MFIEKNKKIKWKKKHYMINVDSYENDRIKIEMYNSKERIELTEDLPDLFIEEGKSFFNRKLAHEGLIPILKKYKIVNSVTGLVNYQYIDIPVISFNFGILRNYDNTGVSKYINNLNRRGGKY